MVTITTDTALRMVAIGEMLMVALVVARSPAQRGVRRGTVLLLASVIGYLLQSTVGALPQGSAVGLIAVLFATITPLALWLFAHALFERRPDPRLAGAAALLLTGSDLARMTGRWCAMIEPGLDRVVHAIMVLLVLDALRLALITRSDDLSEARRRFSLVFVALVAIEALIVLLGEIWFGTGNEPGWLHTTEASLIVAAGLIIGGALLVAEAELIGPAAPVPAEIAPATPTDDWSPAERVLRDRLDAAMAAGAWRQSSLAIGDLADRLGVPEHRLRALINRRLGYRNFSAFLNAHRIAQARAVLSDPAQVAVPVLTIAMDLGYGSLAPFNRAFREATGQTPTEFRKAAFATPGKS